MSTYTLQQYVQDIFQDKTLVDEIIIKLKSIDFYEYEEIQSKLALIFAETGIEVSLIMKLEEAYTQLKKNNQSQPQEIVLQNLSEQIIAHQIKKSNADLDYLDEKQAIMSQNLLTKSEQNIINNLESEKLEQSIIQIEKKLFDESKLFEESKLFDKSKSAKNQSQNYEVKREEILVDEIDMEMQCKITQKLQYCELKNDFPTKQQQVSDLSFSISVQQNMNLNDNTQQYLEDFFGFSINNEHKHLIEKLLSFIKNEETTSIIHLLSSLEQQDQKYYLLTILEKSFPNLFEKICLETNYFEDTEFNKILKQIQMFIAIKKIDKCNEALSKYYGSNKLASIALYLKLKSTIADLKNPKLLEITLEIIKQLNVIMIPESCQECFEMLKICLQDNELESAQEFFFNLENDLKHQQQGDNLIQQILQIIAQIIPQIQKKVEIKQYFDTLRYDKDIDLILQKLRESIVNEDHNNIVKSLKQLMNQQNQTAIEIYPSILKYYPQIENSLQYSQIILNSAPQAIRQKVQSTIEIIETIQSESCSVSNTKTRITKNLLIDIFYDSPQYFQKFYTQFILPNKMLSQIKYPMTLEERCIYSLSKVNQKLKKQVINQVYDITSFMTVTAEYNGQIQEQQLCSYYEIENEILAEPLKNLLFDYIKRRCTFSELISSLSKKKNGCEFTRQIFFNFLKKNSDQYLKTLLYMACSSFMPVPLVSYDWESTERQPVVCEELFYTFEKYKSIFTFKLSSNKNKGPTGCTTLINELFQKDFEKHQKQMTNYGCIDIQFDYNFASPMCVPVADAHGYLSTEILRKVYILFDIFIIHTSNSDDDQLLLEDEVQFLKELRKDCLIIVIEHDEQRSKENHEHKESQNNLHIIKTNPYDDLLQQAKTNLKDQIFNIVIENIGNFEAYKGNYLSRLESMSQFSIFLKNFQIDNWFIHEALRLVSEFLKEIESNADNLHSETFLPLNYIHESICQVQSQLYKESEMHQIKREDLRNQLFSLKEQIKTKEETKIIQIFTEIVGFKNFLGLISIIAKLLKGLLDKQINPLKTRRTQLRTSLQDLDNNEKEQILQKMKNLTDMIEARWFSSEFVIRELYQLGLVEKKHQNKHEQIFMDLTGLQILQAQPFELIDGNNLQFISNVYDKYFKGNQDQILVVSVMGPQSSGKSLLLNFLFGTQFQSATGRCTKGVYGSLLDIKSSGQTKYKKILLLDTEGIQAAEGRDEQFDKRIVFYLLCVSHVILICNKGEMNNQMSEVIKLATDAVSTLKETVVQAPSINIVMNMLAQINESAMEDSIQKLSNAILEMDNGEKMNKLFQINQDNVFNLPYAFDRSGKDKMIVNQPSQEFTRRLEPLKRKILDRVLQFNQRQASNFTLQEWFKFADNFWGFTSTFKGINDYSSLDQKKQDIKIIDKISSLEEESFISKKQKYNKYFDQQLRQILKKYEGASVTKIQSIALEIRGIINSKFMVLQKKVIEEFIKFCSDENINSVLRDKRLNHLLRSINYHQTGWITYTNTQIAEFSDKKSKIIGDLRLQKYLDQYINEKDFFTIEEAKEKFNQAWKVLEEEVSSMLKSEKIVQNEVFQHIHDHYKNEILDKHFEDIDLEKKVLQQFQAQGKGAFDAILQDNRHKIFFFIGNNITPNIDKIIHTLSLKKTYATNIPNDLFIYIKKNTKYNWAQLIQERFLFKKFQKQLKEAYNSWETGYMLKRYRKSSSEKLKKIYQNILLECQCFDIYPTQIMQEIIMNLDRAVIDYSFFKYNLDEEVVYAPSIEKIVDNIQNNITYNFYYKKNICKQAKLSYQYLDKFNINYFKNGTSKTKQSKLLQEDYISYDMVQAGEIIISQEIQGVNFLNSSNSITVNPSFIKESGKNISRYFEFLENPSTVRINETSDECQQAALYFFEAIQWKKVVINIEEIVLENYKVDGKYEVNETVDQCLNLYQFTWRKLELIAANSPLEILRASKDVQQQMFIAKLTSNDKATDSALAAKMAENIWKLINDKNTIEIKKAFNNNLKLVENNFQKLNIIRNIEDQAIQASNLNTSTKRQEQILELDDQEHSSEEESDQDFIKRAGSFRAGRQDYSQKDIYNSTIGPLKKRPNKPIINDMIENDNEFLKHSKNIQNIIEEDAVKFYVDPKELLKNMFNNQWKQVAEIEIEKQQAQFQTNVKYQTKCITQFFESFFQQIISRQANILSTSIFFTKNQIEALANATKTVDILSQTDYSKDMKVLCQMAASQYFISFLSRKYKQNYQFIVGDQTLIVSPSVNLILPEDIPSHLDADIVDCIQEILNGEKISRLGQTINEFLVLFGAKIDKLKVINKDEIVGELLQDFKIQFIGCEEHCPLCRRQCDVPHKQSESLAERVHQCIQGHQIQGFGGNRHFGSNNAITISCNQLQNNDQVIYKDKSMKWIAFKQLFQQWDFGENQSKGALEISNKKNVLIWNYIGKKICDYYKPKFTINFTTATLQKTKTIHYILLLDRSNSMRGSNWENLINAVRQFLKSLEENILLQKTSRVSIIAHDHASQKICYKRIPNADLVDKIQFNSGDNDFDIPLRQAYHWLEKTNDFFDQQVLCFMSDGSWSYPQEAIHQISQNKAIMQKLDFIGIGYGNSSNITAIISKMAKALNGRVKTILEPQELTNAFVKLIPNLYD